MLTNNQPHAAEIRVGLGAYTTALRASSERIAPSTVFKTANLERPLPTNQWYSSLLFTRWSHPLFAHPVSYLAHEEGFQLGLPGKEVVFNQSRAENDITFPHRAGLSIAPLAFEMHDARLDKHSDWAIDIVMGDGTDALKATIAHGSPISYYRISRGGIRIRSGESNDAIHDIFHRSPDGKVLGLIVDGKSYAVFTPAGARWNETSKRELTLHLPAAARYFSVAALPNRAPDTVAVFAKYAYAFITDTLVDWHYDETTSQVTTTFSVKTEVMEGSDNGTLMGLYPHQWHNNALAPGLLPHAYDTVRGKLKLFGGTQFQVRNCFNGVLPFWPALAEPSQKKKLEAYIAADMQDGSEALLGRRGTYWEGKGLGRVTQLMAIAEQQGDHATRDELLAAMKARLQCWLSSEPGSSKYFYYDSTIGTLIGYPDEYGSANEINDHHFHYGYWIFAAAQIALRDPQWAAHDGWGGMIEMLIADIAATDRNHAMFPFLRHFDPYEGHSWASGIVPFIEGNNQESSSEAINAWAGLILWGQATGNARIRDAGIYLYTTEIQAINNYWFDLHHHVFAPEYQNVEAGIVWGDRYVHTTWFTEDPREIHGINMLPLTSASLYLGTDPAFVKRNIDATDIEFAKYLQTEREQYASPQIWQDILLQYYALHDPHEALARWDDKGLVEEGETPSHTYHWIQSLINMGRPDFGITADTPFYSVFRRGDGKKVYLAYNNENESRRITFSDGATLLVPPHRLASASSTAN